jgi:hypothetical protein
MQRFWGPLMSRLCDIVQARAIVEVGLRAGLQSERLLEYCRDHGTECHLIDPVPPWNLEGLQALLAGNGHFHQAISLDALPGLVADLYLLDGDHNWYTVHRELEIIRETAASAGRSFPIVCLHDVAWPYGRRDLYYEPRRIPTSDRQPYARRGMRIGHSELLPSGGFNHRHDNALREGGPRNGVLTAVEDFLAETDEALRFTTVPVFHGLGVIWSPEALGEERTRRLEELLELPPHWRELMELVERARLDAVVELRELTRLVGEHPGRVFSLSTRAFQRLTRPFRRPAALQAVDD